jgi:hypothetical protein
MEEVDEKLVQLAALAAAVTSEEDIVVWVRQLACTLCPLHAMPRGRQSCPHACASSMVSIQQTYALHLSGASAMPGPSLLNADHIRLASLQGLTGPSSSLHTPQNLPKCHPCSTSWRHCGASSPTWATNATWGCPKRPLHCTQQPTSSHVARNRTP